MGKGIRSKITDLAGAITGKTKAGNSDNSTHTQISTPVRDRSASPAANQLLQPAGISRLPMNSKEDLTNATDMLLQNSRPVPPNAIVRRGAIKRQKAPDAAQDTTFVPEETAPQVPQVPETAVLENDKPARPAIRRPAARAAAATEGDVLPNLTVEDANKYKILQGALRAFTRKRDEDLAKNTKDYNTAVKEITDELSKKEMSLKNMQHVNAVQKTILQNAVKDLHTQLEQRNKEYNARDKYINRTYEENPLHEEMGFIKQSSDDVSMEMINTRLNVPAVSQNGLRNCWDAAMRQLLNYRGIIGPHEGLLKIYKKANEAATEGMSDKEKAEFFKTADLTKLPYSITSSEIGELMTKEGLRYVDKPADYQWSAEELSEVLTTHGPLFTGINVAGLYEEPTDTQLAERPGKHVLVLKGVDQTNGDGQLVFNDSNRTDQELHKTLTWFNNRKLTQLIYKPPVEQDGIVSDTAQPEKKPLSRQVEQDGIVSDTAQPEKKPLSRQNAVNLDNHVNADKLPTSNTTGK